eukprot:TRINITY_DN22135_c0_g1_i6.p1 TRINITY_DN22135_c0_g1~~TRINITY_DN22135_c0_g1_i6.p1  ORF type:complete len:362 (-),score=36.96 TRINITY_DN22135_c0_g1_i6:454-1539(-)
MQRKVDTQGSRALRTPRPARPLRLCLHFSLLLCILPPCHEPLFFSARSAAMMTVATTTGFKQYYGQHGGYGGYGPARGGYHASWRQQQKPYQQPQAYKPYRQEMADVASYNKSAQQSDGNELQAMYFCEDLQDWLKPEASHFRGLAVSRPGLVSYDEYQQVVDAFVAATPRNDVCIEGLVDVPARNNPEAVRQVAEEAARRLFASLRLPQKLLDQIIRDAINLFQTMSQLVPGVKQLEIKLESFGWARCKFWHQDYYLARSFICYCGPGTEYLDPSNVDWDAFHRLPLLAGTATIEDHARIAKNRQEVKSVGTGDIILIKGKQFPGKSAGLVHKSPEPDFYPSGRIKNRLCLKVDIPCPGH